MAMKYKGKRFRIHPAKGLRFGFGYLPHYKSNPSTSTPREFMVWVGPWIMGWKINKRGWKPRHWADQEQLAELHRARIDIENQIFDIEHYWHRQGKHAERHN